MKIKDIKYLPISLCLLFVATFLYPETKPQHKPYPAQGAPPHPLEQGKDGHWTANGQSANAEGYEVHTVKTGETLWNITKQYLNDPFLWPQIWEMNPNVSNPHWIYPGDQILLKKKMAVMAPAPGAPSQSSPVPSAPSEPAQPAPARTAKSEPVSEAPPAVTVVPSPPPAPTPVAQYSDLYCAGFFSGEKLSPLAVVIGGEASEHRALFSDQDIVYLSRGTVAGIKAGDELQVVRLEDSFGKWGPQFNPAKSKSKYGYYYVDIGRVRVLFAKENSATAQVLFACGEISVEDQIIPGEDRVSPMRRDPVAFEKFAPPSGKTHGKVFMTKEYLTQTGDGDIVFLDLGKRDNIQVGDYLRIARSFSDSNISLFNKSAFRKHEESFAEVRKVIGEAVVIRVAEKTATCLIIYSTEEIMLGDTMELE
ncbi:MAG: LysM peptidoglycan-binding domain-containing protein [Terriglobia bacterium]